MSRPLAAALLLGLSLTACDPEEPKSDDSGDPTVDDTGVESVTPTLSSIQSGVFDSCASSGCHAASSAAGGLDLSSASASHANLVGVTPDEANAASDGYQRVSAGDPGNSYLYALLQSETTPEYANTMPKAGTAPDADAIEAIRQWIEDGAAQD